MSNTKYISGQAGVEAGDQRWFRDVLKLCGHEVEVGLLSTGAVLRGKITYTMFDSFILESRGTPRVIRFEDLNFLLPEPNKH